MHKRGFTLIELLVVIAILAVLAVVVVLTLNPAGLLQESRDSNRISDMATLNSALGYSLADNAAESLGSANTVYVSIADNMATSTAGDQCQGLNLITLPSGYSYHCAASSTYRQTNGNGWIPVNLQNNTFGSSLAQLPTDPVNATSSRLWYTYETDGNGKYEITSAMESAKYQLGGTSDIISGDGGTLASVYEKGSKLGLEPLDYGDSSLVDYWAFEEGSSSIAYDYSGNNATGSWNGTPTGTAGYYSAGKIGSWDGAFDGSSTYVNAGNPTALNITSNVTIVAWVNEANCSHHEVIDKWNGSGGYVFNMFSGCSPSLYVSGGTFSNPNTWIVSTSTIAPSTWYQVAMTYNGNSVNFYVNGSPAGSTAATGAWATTSNSLGIGQNRAAGWFSGLIDDVRIYNRALAAPQIQAMYAGGK